MGKGIPMKAKAMIPMKAKGMKGKRVGRKGVIKAMKAMKALPPSDGQVVPWYNQAPGQFKGKEAKDAKDGETDDRKTSRAQRWVFTHHLHEVDAAIVKRYQELSKPDCKEPGKRAQINTIINSIVPRNSSYKAAIQPKVK